MADNTYDALIVVACNRYGVPFALAKAIMLAESNGNPRAWRLEPKLPPIDGKPDGSRGLFQMIGRTARGMGYKGPLGDDTARAGGLYDPATSIDYGVRYIRDLLRTTGNVMEDTISAYNGGIRPNLGYGRKAAKPVTVCNAWDKDGNCIARRTVAVGEYGNQPYVNRVAAAIRKIEAGAVAAATSAAQTVTTAAKSPAGRVTLSVVFLVALLGGAIFYLTTNPR